MRFHDAAMANPLIWMMLHMSRPRKNTEQRFSRKLKHVFLLHFGVGKRGEKAIRQCLTLRPKFHWFTVTASPKDYKKTSEAVICIGAADL